MSLSITDAHGRRYHLSHGWGTHSCQQANQFRGHYDAAKFVESLNHQQSLAIQEAFFSGADQRPRHLRIAPLRRELNKPRSLRPLHSRVGNGIVDAISKSHLVVRVEVDAQASSDGRQSLRLNIRHALASLVMAEQQEAARHSALMDQETTLNKGLIYTGAAMTGLGKAAWGLLVWAKEVSDLANPLVRLHNSYKSARAAWGSDDFAQAFANHQLSAEWREVVEVIGFDPSQISQQQLAEAMDAADIVWSDNALRNNLKDFAWNYAKAQHAVELTEMGGGAAFEILFTAILAAVTGGLGLFAATAAKARHVRKFKKLGELLVDFAKATRQLAKRSTSKAKPSKPKPRSFDELKTDMPARERSGEGPKNTKKDEKSGGKEHHAEDDGATFEGNAYRSVAEGRDPLEIHPVYNKEKAVHRYTGAGQGGLYLGSSQRIVNSEFIGNGASIEGLINNVYDVKIDNLLDLTNPAVRTELGVELKDLVRTGGTKEWRYEITNPLGKYAEGNGYNGIIAPAAQADGGVNLIIFDPKLVK